MILSGCVMMNMQGMNVFNPEEKADLEKLNSAKEQEATAVAQDVVQKKDTKKKLDNKCEQEGATAKYEALKRGDWDIFNEISEKDPNLDCDLHKALKEGEIKIAQEIDNRDNYRKAIIKNYEANRWNPFMLHVLSVATGAAMVGSAWLFKVYILGGAAVQATNGTGN